VSHVPCHPFLPRFRLAGTVLGVPLPTQALSRCICHYGEKLPLNGLSEPGWVVARGCGGGRAVAQGKQEHPNPPACSVVLGLQLGACECPAAYSVLKPRAASSSTGDGSGLVPAMAWGLYWRRLRACAGLRVLGSFPGLPGDRCLAAMCPCHPTTGWGCTRGTPWLPIPSTTSILLLCPGPRHGTASPASATVSPSPGSELTCMFLLFGFCSEHKILDPGSLSAKQAGSLVLPRQEQQHRYALRFAASLQGQFDGKQSAGAHRQGGISGDGWQTETHRPDVCVCPGVASLVLGEMSGAKENWSAPSAPCLVHLQGDTQPPALSPLHPDGVLSCL